MSIDDLLARALFRVGSEVASEARSEAPHITGNLRRDIQVFDHGLPSVVEVGNSLMTPYAAFVHEGTGLFGPHKTRVVPKKAKALKTPWGYRKSTKGMKGNPYLKNALDSYVQSPRLVSAITAHLGPGVARMLTEEIKKDFPKDITIQAGI